MSGSAMKVGVVTPVRGRLEHLANQRRFLAEVAPEAHHYIVAVDTPGVTGGATTTVIPLADDPLGMPTAKARNRGANAAVADGCDLLIFLDVDCAPLPGFLERFCAAAAEHEHQVALNAPVTYLAERDRLDSESPSSATRFVSPHEARPNPADDTVELNDDHHLLWSLAFAMTRDAWERIDGFDERYVGYGAEDTDFGMRVRAAGLAMAWVGGAHVLHQWHPSANPPVRHLVDIVRNATIYRERWGGWPMEGWLQAFADDGLVVWTETELSLTDEGRSRLA